MSVRKLLLVAAALGAASALPALLPPPPVLGVVAAPAAEPPGHRFGAPVFTADARGDIVTIGNVTTTCDPGYANANWSTAESAAACSSATTGAATTVRFDGEPMPPINNRFSMRFVDVDDDPSTFASSRARLAIPEGSVVLWAGVHWNAATEVPSAAALQGSDHHEAPVAVAARDRIRLTPPGGTPAEIRAQETWSDTNPGGTTSYAGYADVTEQVRRAGSGLYTVADVQSCRGFGGCFGSWSMTVAFAHPEQPARNLNVWHGWQLTTPSRNEGVQEFGVTGIEPPPHGPVQARIGVVQADGDRGLGPDSLEISSPSSRAWRRFASIDRPLAEGEQDWFNSTVNAYGRRRTDADAQPNLLANLNQDIAMVEDHQIVSNTDTSFRFRVRTGGTESLYSQVVHAAVDLYQPTIALDKTVDPVGPVEPGSEVTWTLKVANEGIDPIRRAVVTDVLPDELTYVPGSVRYQTGGPVRLLGPKTDAPGDDQAEWDARTRTLRFRVGADAGAKDGGQMAVAPSSDGSHQLTITFRTVVTSALDTTAVNAAEATGQGRALDDSFGPLVTRARDQASIATPPSADLGIDKTDGDAVVDAIGDTIGYRLTVTNAGPSAATGVVATDVLDPRLRFAASDDGCTAADQTVTCPVGDLAAGATASRSFTATVSELPGPGRSLPNVATVTGDQPNPDCDAEHPRARCNQDDEQTPQPPAATTTTAVTTSTTTAPSTTAPAAPTTAPPTRDAPRPSGNLPRTGSNPAIPVIAGLTLLALGSTVLVARRRLR
jgi:uncharacterized repeat protein (TIGR01451 family)/LPXTG-motif cell wall-anchored protein